MKDLTSCVTNQLVTTVRKLEINYDEISIQVYHENLLLMMVLSDTMCSLIFRSSTSRRQVQFPPSLLLSLASIRAPRVSRGSVGSGFRRVCCHTPSLYHEILISLVRLACLPSVILQKIVMFSPSCSTPKFGTDTEGISSSK